MQMGFVLGLASGMALSSVDNDPPQWAGVVAPVAFSKLHNCELAREDGGSGIYWKCHTSDYKIVYHIETDARGQVLNYADEHVDRAAIAIGLTLLILIIIVNYALFCKRKKR